jgi:hypothetical protein
VAGAEPLSAGRPDGTGGERLAGAVGVALLVSGSKGVAKNGRCRPYRAGRAPDWIKVKNRKHPSIERGSSRRSHDRQRRWADKPVDSTLTIDAAIHDAVMALPPDERRDRARRLARTIKDGAQIA